MDARSKHLRRQIILTALAGGRGHIGPAFSLVEILRVLFDDVMRYDPHNPKWEERDRLILSKGHGYLALYALLADKGFFPESELWNFGHAGALLGVHPSRHIPGVEFDTGSLGHGLSLGCGMAKAKRNRRVFVVLGDGECQEGAVYEAAQYARKHELDDLTAIIDGNGMQASGKTQNFEWLFDQWVSFGWSVHEIDGHSIDQLQTSLILYGGERPLIIIAHTVKGKGITAIENNLAWHHKSKLTAEDGRWLLEGLEAYE